MSFEDFRFTGLVSVLHEEEIGDWLIASLNQTCLGKLYFLIQLLFAKNE